MSWLWLRAVSLRGRCLLRFSPNQLLKSEASSAGFLCSATGELAGSGFRAPLRNAFLVGNYFCKWNHVFNRGEVVARGCIYLHLLSPVNLMNPTSDANNQETSSKRKYNMKGAAKFKGDTNNYTNLSIPDCLPPPYSPTEPSASHFKPIIIPRTCFNMMRYQI